MNLTYLYPPQRWNASLFYNYYNFYLITAAKVIKPPRPFFRNREVSFIVKKLLKCYRLNVRPLLWSKEPYRNDRIAYSYPNSCCNKPRSKPPCHFRNVGCVNYCRRRGNESQFRPDFLGGRGNKAPSGRPVCSPGHSANLCLSAVAFPRRRKRAAPGKSSWIQPRFPRQRHARQREFVRRPPPDFVPLNGHATR